MTKLERYKTHATKYGTEGVYDAASDELGIRELAQLVLWLRDEHSFKLTPSEKEQLLVRLLAKVAL